jgi:hypothetical protein
MLKNIYKQLKSGEYKYFFNKDNKFTDSDEALKN